MIADAGHGERFPHGLGHGVGLAVHEPPWLGVAATGRIEAGNVVTVEPGVYLDGRGGVRIEDTLHVVAGGPGPGADRAAARARGGLRTYRRESASRHGTVAPIRSTDRS